MQEQQKQLRQRLQHLFKEADQYEQALARYGEPATSNPLVRALLAEHQHARAIAAIEQQAQPISEMRKTSASHTPPAANQSETKEVAPEPVAQQPLQRAANTPSLAIWGEAPVPTAQTSPAEQVIPEPQIAQTPQLEQTPTRPIPTAPGKPESAPSHVYEAPSKIATPAPTETPNTLPVDQQSERVNQLVKRWAQRWHRETMSPNAPPTNNERR
ncbi:hypothetical protein KSX_33720 [Ktedonospora formicarum]|uniref:Uncharacterized protein n=1 Tax=Ktedonospora formicarum TaxID=2778364 RepID=A0A8J3HWT0_9CHLR|nr:hypothetical protein KSX_33720 [Ktedonospora formicarum]